MKVDLALAGCRPDPLGSYLKALAVLRLVGEQKDPTAKGYWNDDVFHLVSGLDEAALVEFFAVDYAPTPIVGPWNGGSGFYEGDDCSALDFIMASPNPRVGPLRTAISQVRNAPMFPKTRLSLKELCDEVLRAVGPGESKQRTTTHELVRRIESLVLDKEILALNVDELPAAPKGLRQIARKLRTQYKKLFRVDAALAQYLRGNMPDDALSFIDAAVGFGPEKLAKLGVVFGGNEGRNNYTYLYLECVRSLLERPRDGACGLVANSLFGRRTSNLENGATGMMLPGAAGGANQDQGFEVEKLPRNPIEFLLALEGSASLAGASSKRLDNVAPSSPFFLSSSAGTEISTPADATPKNREFWAPLWERSATLVEVGALLAEGRASVGHRSVRRGIDMIGAMASLGTDRGISSFTRFSIMESRGQGSFVSRVSGRFAPAELSGTGLAGEVVALFEEYESQARRKWKKLDRVPKRVASAALSLERALFQYGEHPSQDRGIGVVASCGRLERMLASTGVRQLRPLQGLSTRWISASRDCLELRVAVGLASIKASGDVGCLRANLVPLEPRKPHVFAAGTGQTAWEGNSLTLRMGSILRRRLIDFERLTCECLPLKSSIEISAADVAAFIEGRVDESLLEDLLFGLTWIDWRARRPLEEVRERWKVPIVQTAIPPVYALMKSVLDPRHASCEPRIVPLLLAGRVERAIEMATVRLRVADLRPVSFAPVRRPFRMIRNASIDPVRLAASLLIPVRNPAGLLRLVTHAPTEERKEA